MTHETDDLKRHPDVDSIAGLLGRLYDTLELVRKRVHDQSNSVQGIHLSLVEINGHLKTLNGRTAALEARAASLEQRAQSLETLGPLREEQVLRFEAGLKRLDSIESFRDRVIGYVIGSGLLSGGIVAGVIKALG